MMKQLKARIDVSSLVMQVEVGSECMNLGMEETEGGHAAVLFSRKEEIGMTKGRKKEIGRTEEEMRRCEEQGFRKGTNRNPEVGWKKNMKKRGGKGGRRKQ